jgi:hypothetical protein
VVGQLLAHSLRLRVRQVRLVDRHDDRHLGVLGVAQSLEGLRHHAVVGRDDQDDEVGGLSAAGSHLGEGSVARGVDEDDLTVSFPAVHPVGADVLRDAAGLAGRHARLSDVVEQRRLAVIDVAHDRDHRRAGLEVLLAVRRGLERLVLLEGDVLHLVAELVGDDLGGVEVDRGVDVDPGHAHAPQLLEQLGRLDAHVAGQVRHRDRVLDADDALVLRRGRDEGLLAALLGHLLADVARSAPPALLLLGVEPAHLTLARHLPPAGTALGDLDAGHRQADDRAHLGTALLARRRRCDLGGPLGLPLALALGGLGAGALQLGLEARAGVADQVLGPTAAAGLTGRASPALGRTDHLGARLHRRRLGRALALGPLAFCALTVNTRLRRPAAGHSWHLDHLGTLDDVS